MENKLNMHTVLFDDKLEAFNLISKVNFPTHIANHTLDLVITQQDSSMIQSIERGELLSDHHFINFKVLMETKKQLFKVIKCRSLKNIDAVELSQDLAINTTQMMHNGTTDVTTLAQQYNGGMAEIMVKHAPIKTKKIKIKHHQPWFNDRLKSEIKLRRWNKKCGYRIQQNTIYRPSTTRGDLLQIWLSLWKIHTTAIYCMTTSMIMRCSSLLTNSYSET